MNHLTFLFCFLLILSSSSLATATNVTFSDLDLPRNTDILIYAAESASSQPTLVGTYNTTSTVDLDPGCEYMIVFKPGIDHWYKNPLNALELFNAEAPSFLSFFVFLVVIVGAGKIIFR